MESSASAAFASWSLDLRPIFVLVLTAAIYIRGWMRRRQTLRTQKDYPQLFCFLGGLAVLFVATESPLDSFDRLFLSAHMAQHLLLLMVAPPLVLLGAPMIPLLRGLPKEFVREGLGPFLRWRPLTRFVGWLVSPPVAWPVFALSTILWHLPVFYELALRNPAWHAVQHASFFWTGILFWWPVIRPEPYRSRWPEWILVPYLLFADIVNTALSAFFVFSGNLLYPSYTTVRLGGIRAQDDQILAGAIMWVPGSILYLLPAIYFAMRLLSKASRQRRATPVLRMRPAHRAFSLKRMQAPAVRRLGQIAMLLVAIAVVVDGFFGPQVGSLNLAGVLPWIHWRAFTVIALLAVGNLFCMTCPFVLVRDFGRKLLPASWRWPRMLRTKWLSIGLLVVYLWAYEGFSMWDRPWATAWLITGYFLAALIIDGLFRGASFCKYVCPIGQFNFIGSLVSPREIAVRRASVCTSCKTHDCIRGNESARGCELYLFQPRKASNLDCTFCLDCVNACPHDNVTLLPVLPAATLLQDENRSSLGRLSKRSDWAILALVIVFGAFVNAAGMVQPVMLQEHRWGMRFGLHNMPEFMALFVAVALIVVPSVAMLLCIGANRLVSTGVRVFDIGRRFAFALVPIGFAMWAAHVLYHLVTDWSAPIAVMQRLANVSSSAMSAAPSWLVPLQILLLDAGLLLTLYIAWRIAYQSAARFRSAVELLLPWGTLASVLYGIGIWILFQPMIMRGMKM